MKGVIKCVTTSGIAMICWLILVFVLIDLKSKNAQKVNICNHFLGLGLRRGVCKGGVGEFGGSEFMICYLD